MFVCVIIQHRLLLLVVILHLQYNLISTDDVTEEKTEKNGWDMCYAMTTVILINGNGNRNDH